MGAALLPVDAPARVLGVVDGLGNAPAVLGEIGHGARERYGLRPRAQADSRENEVAGGGTPRSVRGQGRVGKRLEAQRRDRGAECPHGDGVGVLVRLRPRHQERAVLLLLERSGVGGDDADGTEEGPAWRSRRQRRLPGRELGGEVGGVDRLLERVRFGLEGVTLLQPLGWCELQIGLDDPLVPHDVAQALHAVVRVVEEGQHPVVVLLGDGVELVVVALRAGHGAAEPRRGGRVHAVHQRLPPRLFDVDPSLLVEEGVPVEAGRDLLLRRGLGEHVTRDLLDGEVAERQVPVEGVDDPVAVHPRGPAPVLLVAVRVGVSREVQPGTRPALTVVRRGEQAVDDLLVGIRARVGQERVHLRQRRRKADEVEAHAADQGFATGLGRGAEPFTFQPREHEAVDRVPDPGRVHHRRRLRPHRLAIGPVPLVGGLRIDGSGRAGIDPGLDPRDLLGRKRRAFEGHPRLQDAGDPLDERAAAAVAGKHDRSRHPAAQRPRPRVETELAALLLRAMATRAAGAKDRLDVAREVHTVLGPPRERGPEEEGRDERRAHGRVPVAAF